MDKILKLYVLDIGFCQKQIHKVCTNSILYPLTFFLPPTALGKTPYGTEDFGHVEGIGG